MFKAVREYLKDQNGWSGWWESFIDKVVSPIDLSFITPPKDYATIKKYALRWFKFRKLFKNGHQRVA
jgi:hypothetical protein